MRTLVSVFIAAIVAGCSGAPGGTPPGSSAGAGNGTPTAAPTAAPTPEPSFVARGITRWTLYTSEVYGITFGYPEHWHVEAAATRTWQEGDGFDFGPFTDIFISPDNEIAFSVLRMTAGPGADIGSRERLGAFVCDREPSACQAISDAAEPMCLGPVACQPAVLVLEPVFAFFADSETRMVTVVSVGREDGFPGAAQYGGSVELLRSILTTMDVWTPEPGQIPSAS